MYGTEYAYEIEHDIWENTFEQAMPSVLILGALAIPQTGYRQCNIDKENRYHKISIIIASYS